MAELELMRHLREHSESKKIRNVEKRHGNLDEWKEFAETMKHESNDKRQKYLNS